MIRFLYGRAAGDAARDVGHQPDGTDGAPIFGAQNVQVENPSWMSGGIEASGVVAAVEPVVIIGFAVGSPADVAARAHAAGTVRGAVTPGRAMAAAPACRRRVTPGRSVSGRESRDSRVRTVADQRQCRSRSRAELYHRFVHGASIACSAG